MNPADFTITSLDRVLRTIAGVTHAGRPSPAISAPEQAMTPEERRHSAGLMRVNHVGEVCAQALYDAQGRNAKTAALRAQFALAGKEEEDHLAWTAERLAQLGSQPSLLNPFWYLGAYAFGVLAAKSGDAYSLGFVVETERQVEAHLDGHLEALPATDAKSRAIVEQMKQDEIDHGAAARDLGAAELPGPVQFAMKSVARLMTTAAYYI